MTDAVGNEPDHAEAGIKLWYTEKRDDINGGLPCKNTQKKKYVLLWR